MKTTRHPAAASPARAASLLAAILAAAPAFAQAPVPAPAPAPGLTTPSAATPTASVPAPAASPASQPPLAIKGGKSQNVGVRSPLELIKGSFSLRNMGTAPLVVTKIDAGCRCTFGAMVDPTIAPGAEGVMNFEIDVRGTLGKLNKPLKVFCAGYTAPVEVYVQGELQYAVRVDQPQLKPGAGGIAEFTLTSSDGTPFSVLSVAGEAPEVVSTNPPGAAPGSGKALSWTLRYNVLRSLPYVVTVETDHPKAPVIDLRNYAPDISNSEIKYIKVMNNLAIGRHVVNLGVVKPAGSAEFDMYITRSAEVDDQPVTLATDGGDVKLELIETFPWRRTDDTGLKIRATFKEGVAGTRLFPIYVTSGSYTNRTWAVAVVK